MHTLLLAAQNAEEGGGTQINVVVIALLVALVVGAIMWFRRTR